MALFFNRISKLSARRDNARFFSTLPQSPYLLIGGKLLRESPEGKIGKHRFFDPTTQERVYSSEKTTPKELKGQPLLGTSQGWVACLENKDFTVHLTDLYKPWVSSSPRVISLPSIGFEPSTHATEMSLSSSDPVQDDFIVAAKFSEYQLSVCRPRWDSKWTHIDTPFSLLPPSDLMYSKRDKTFYFTSFKGLYMGYLDLSENELEFQELILRNQPKIPEAGWEMLDKCFMRKLLVESPSGELFFIKWYTLCIRREDEDGESIIMHSITKRFMVFREDEKRKDFCYTEDIGDLCIFLGDSEAFCVTASMYPGLKPNSIYYIGVSGLGSYDLASGTVRSFDPPGGRPWLVPYPFWLRPTNPIA
uniref:KIB1-4 beta-propeller domain-containing protein n=3 Tax=Noccaea caerulescens TaxID=107243 RepID=A0A1J3H7Q6_NOCCA